MTYLFGTLQDLPAKPNIKVSQDTMQTITRNSWPYIFVVSSDHFSGGARWLTGASARAYVREELQIPLKELAYYQALFPPKKIFSPNLEELSSFSLQAFIRAPIASISDLWHQKAKRESQNLKNHLTTKEKVQAEEAYWKAVEYNESLAEERKRLDGEITQRMIRLYARGRSEKRVNIAAWNAIGEFLQRYTRKTGERIHELSREVPQETQAGPSPDIQHHLPPALSPENFLAAIRSDTFKEKLDSLIAQHISNGSNKQP